MDRLKHLCLIVALATATFATAQDNVLLTAVKTTTTSIQETLFVHTNASTFISGETFYCKLYALNPANYSISKVSKIAYIELIDNNRNSVFKQKVYLENGIGVGDFFIPTTLQTGNYKLVAYTRWMLNQADFAYQMNVSIINPFQPLEKKGIASETVDIQNRNSELFALKTDKKNYSLREKININIKALRAISGGNYSVSVRKIAAIPYQKQATAVDFIALSQRNIINSKPISVLPELRGEVVTGSISSKKDDTNLNHKTVALSITGKSYLLKIAETDRLGNFTFILDKQPNRNELVVQVVDEHRDDYVIKLDTESTPNWSELQFLPQAPLSQELQNTIEERAVASQIENAYYAQKKDSIVANLESDSFFHSKEKEYVLDDYTRFSTIKETITEVLTELYFTKKNNKYSINLRNYTLNNEGYGLPLLLVDGLLIQDANELFDYNPENIYKFSIINEPYVYGPKTFSGVINITTKNQDYQTKAKGDFIKTITIQRPLNPKFYFQPDYSKNTYKRIPDYRYQLLWQPQLRLENGERNISFYASDVSGKFEIILEGFTNEGLPVSIKDFFEIK